MSRSHKTALGVAVAAFAATGAAHAADPAIATPVVAPMMPMVEQPMDWSGLYVGLGGSIARQSYEFDGDAGAGQPDFAFYPSVYGGELVLGSNTQLGPIVFGLEGTAGLYGFSGTGSGDLSELFPSAPDNIDFDYRSSGYSAGLSGRLGYLLTPNVLLYGSGGANAIYSNNDTTFTYVDPLSDEEKTETLEYFGNLFGTIGGGVEVALSQAVSVDLEYEYGFSAAGLLAEHIPELSGLSSNSHTISAQVLFHF